MWLSLSGNSSPWLSGALLWLYENFPLFTKALRMLPGVTRLQSQFKYPNTSFMYSMLDYVWVAIAVQHAACELQGAVSFNKTVA
eukprot:scaffold157991_cov18-Tisochrysis_lutea.AAC.1